MAALDAILGFAAEAPTKTAALAASASSGEIVIQKNRNFAIVGTGAFNLKFGTSGMAAAAATDFLIPANTITVLNMTSQFDRVRVFNSGASAIDIYAQPLTIL